MVHPVAILAALAASRREPELALQSPPPDWMRIARARPEATVQLTFAVQARPDAMISIDRLLAERSNPSSKLYAQWISADEAAALSVDRQSCEYVMQWLQNATGAAGVEVAPGFVSANVSVRVAEALLNTSYALYEHRHSGMRAIRCEYRYTVPSDLPVSFVSPTLKFPSTRSLIQEDISRPGCCYWRTPAVLRQLYGVGTTTGEPSARQHVPAFSGQYFSQSDLQLYLTKYASWAAGQKVVRIVGPNNQTRRSPLR